jgi:hypothetical protein
VSYRYLALSYPLPSEHSFCPAQHPLLCCTSTHTTMKEVLDLGAEVLMAGKPLLLTCLEPTGLDFVTGATQERFYVPEPPSHVEEPRVRGRG